MAEELHPLRIKRREIRAKSFMQFTEQVGHITSIYAKVMP